MRKFLSIIATLVWFTTQMQAQVEPDAGAWKTWFITSGKAWRLPAPRNAREETVKVVQQQQQLDAAGLQRIFYWNAGAPGYRWQQFIYNLWMYDTSYNGVLANMLLNVATYDATIAAWDTKYAYKRPRPYETNSSIKLFIPKPGSPSYPCEHSVAAGVAATIIGHFYPAMADSVNRLAKQMMESRIAAGVAFPEDTRAGFELGKHIAEKEIEYTKNFTNKTAWDGKMPQQPGYWKGRPHLPMAGHNKTVVLDSSSQFRPGPPPDFAKDMEELKKFKPGFRSNANAYYYASVPDEVLHQKIFEYNLHLNPPRAARMYAIAAIGIYDGFAACWDAKYTYWGIRPDQYDTTYHALLPTPPFPGYPSGHAMIGGVMAELYAYFFPGDKALFDKRAKDGAESRFQGGIHFRTDNETGVAMGRKVGAWIVQKVKQDGADEVSRR